MCQILKFYCYFNSTKGQKYGGMVVYKVEFKAIYTLFIFIWKLPKHF